MEFPIENISNLSKILVNKFCQGVTNKLTYLPICKHSERIKRLKMEFQLLKNSEAQPQENILSPAEVKELDYIINLQTFKHELKTTFSQEKLLDFIFGFKCVLAIKISSENRTSMILNRNSQAYFNYLEEVNEQAYLESPYAKYILAKLTSTDKIKQLLESRKNLRVSQRILYQKGAISSETYYQRISALED